MSNIDHDAKLQELLKEVRMYKNPEELEEMKKIIKKNVPFSMRGYFMAYLYITRTGNFTTKQVKPQKKQVARPSVENATAFYINVGKASRSNSKELAEFICEKTGMNNEDIISIAFKQNYSFVYIKNDKTDGVIEAVTGQTFKGRKVKMNFSKETGEEK